VAGRTVVAIGRSAVDLDEVAMQTGAVPLVLDVSDPAAVEMTFARILSDIGVPDQPSRSGSTTMASSRRRTWRARLP
jgi:hypothetical protein